MAAVGLMLAAATVAIAASLREKDSSRPATYADRPSLFGLNTLTYDNDYSRVARDIAEAEKLGVQWVRTYAPGVKPSGELDFADLDARLADIRKHGLSPLLMIGGFADTCASRWQGACPPTRSAEKLYERHLHDLVAHYRGKVTYYESWNEPDQTVFFRPKPSPKRYADVLKLQYRVVKRANPQARLLFAPVGGTNLRFTSQILEALDGARVFDAVAIHPYRLPPTNPDARNPVALADGRVARLTFKEELLATAKLFHRNGYGRQPMWITEFGWGAKDETGGNGGVTLAQQARYLERTYTLLRDDPELSFVKVAFWFNLRDYAPDAIPSRDEAFFAHYGLETTDFGRKPAAEAYRRLATARRTTANEARPRIGCDPSRGVKVVPDERGVYLSAYANTVGPDGGPGSAGRHRAHLAHFKRAAGKGLALAYVLNPLLKGEFEFPAAQARAAWESGAVPLVSLLPISDWNVLTRGTADPIFTLQRFVDGDFDSGLKRWARGAKASRIPLMVVFGQEIKAAGWPWDAKFNGGGRTNGYGDPAWPDGPERFRDAFRHVVKVFRKAGVGNVTWVYWTALPFDSAGNYPAQPKSWDLDRYYYPGDDYVDWVAGGAYGYFPQGGWSTWKPLSSLVDTLYEQLTAFAPKKPQLLELAVAHSPDKGDMARWIRDAYMELASGRWPNLRAANWWHQRVKGSTTAVDITPGVRRAFREAVAPSVFLEEVKFKCGR